MFKPVLLRRSISILIVLALVFSSMYYFILPETAIASTSGIDLDFATSPFADDTANPPEQFVGGSVSFTVTSELDDGEEVNTATFTIDSDEVGLTFDVDLPLDPNTQVPVDLAPITNLNDVGTVTLTATNDAGSDVESKALFIRVINADFSVDPTSGEAPLTVQFTDESEGTVLGRFWDFNGDGLIDSTEEDPEFTYDTPGTRTVVLVVFGAAGFDIEVKANFIEVFELPVAQFTATNLGGSAPRTVRFVNLSTGNPDTFAWDFGTDVDTDGDNIADSSTSTDENPMVTYLSGGDFEVSLTVTNDAGQNTDTETKTDFLQLVRSDFTLSSAGDLDNGAGILDTAPVTVFFTDAAEGPVLAHFWDLDGDGGIDSLATNPNFVFTEAGTFTVRHYVIAPDGFDLEEKVAIIVVE